MGTGSLVTASQAQPFNRNICICVIVDLTLLSEPWQGVKTCHLGSRYIGC
jgi:hypothetical protein